MKNIQSRITIILFGFVLILFGSCKENNDHGHDHNQGGHDHTPVTQPTDEHADHDEHNHEKIIKLNQAQYKNAEIDTGWFAMKNINDVVNANGYTRVDPQDEADVNMPVSGTITSVKIIEGNYVKKGQTLATMVSMEYNRLLLEKSQVQEKLNVSEANLVYLQQEYDRQESLDADQISAKKVFQKVSADLRTEKAKINGLKQQIEIMNSTIGLISNSGNSTIRIPAPISGFITEVNVKIGSITSSGQPMFSIVDNSKMHVDLLVYEKDLASIEVGQTVRFILTNQSNQEIKGEIYNIGKSFANDTKSVAVHADIEKNDANLIRGMYINALIDIGTEKVQTLPEEAIVLAEGRSFIYIWEVENIKKADHHDHNGNGHDHGHDHASVKDEISFARLEVKTGAKQLGYVEVTPLQKIHKGDKIVTSGAYYLQSHLQKAESGGGHSH